MAMKLDVIFPRAHPEMSTICEALKEGKYWLDGRFCTTALNWSFLAISAGKNYLVVCLRVGCDTKLQKDKQQVSQTSWFRSWQRPQQPPHTHVPPGRNVTFEEPRIYWSNFEKTHLNRMFLFHFWAPTALHKGTRNQWFNTLPCRRVSAKPCRRGDKILTFQRMDVHENVNTARIDSRSFGVNLLDTIGLHLPKAQSLRSVWVRGDIGQWPRYNRHLLVLEQRIRDRHSRSFLQERLTHKRPFANHLGI